MGWSSAGAAPCATNRPRAQAAISRHRPQRYHGLNTPPSAPRPLPAQDRRGSLRNNPKSSAGGDITSSPTAISPPALACIHTPAATGYRANAAAFDEDPGQ